MAYRPTYTYLLNPSGNGFTVQDGSSDPNYTITNPADQNDTAFSAADALIASNQSSSFQLIYVGRTTSGFVGMDFTGQFYYFGSETYAAGDYFEIEALPFPVCFVKGTLVTSPRGVTAIEDLAAGDLVLGSTGWRTVKWLGWRCYGHASFLTQEGKTRIAPVRVRAHAIDDNVPSNDLLVSAWHHLFVEGKLVRAGDLVNGTTITQETNVKEVTYYHVELDHFDVIMAHGLYSESWADGGNRDFFQNADITSLRPEDKQRRRAPRPGFDHLILREGQELAAIQRRVAQRAKAGSHTEVKTQNVA